MSGNALDDTDVEIKKCSFIQKCARCAYMILTRAPQKYMYGTSLHRDHFRLRADPKSALILRADNGLSFREGLRREQLK